MDTEQITRETLAAWDEVQAEEEQRAEEQGPFEPLPPEEEVSTDESDAEAEEAESSEELEEEPAEEVADAEGDEEPEGEEEEADEQGEGEQVTAYADNPRLQAFLAKYDNDPEKALLAAAHLTDAIGRQGLQMGEQAKQIEALQAELAQLHTFGPPGNVLTPEQREWAVQAIESEQPGVYVQEALRAGEFTLARAVCDGWSAEAPYEAARLAQHVDNVEQQARIFQQQQQHAEEAAIPWDMNTLMEVLVENYPDMPQFQEQMVAAVSTLGEAHPFVQDAKSKDPEVAAKGILGLYEIARSQSATVKTTRAKVKRDGRQAADEARAAAVVSSGSASPKPVETPRPRELMPGLTMEALDEAWSSSR